MSTYTKPNFWLAISVIFVFSWLVACSPVSAVTISPLKFDYFMNPGDSRQGEIKVINETAETQTYYASVQNFVANGEEGQQTFLNETEKTGLVSWTSLEQKVVTLAPGKSDDFKWVINIPKNAEPGGHYAAIFFSTQPETDQGKAVGVGGRVGVLFLVNVNGNVREGASVESFQTVVGEDPQLAIPTGWTNRLPVGFELRIKNSGSVHFKPVGEISVESMFGKNQSIQANPNDSAVLPNTIRKIRSSFGPRGLPVGGFFQELKNEWKGLAFGKYIARANVSYGQNKQTLTAETSFWVLPWRLGIVAVLCVGILILLISGYNKLVIRSAMRKSVRK